ncbi:MAG: FixH family protein [Planctomycetes bacterium]|nr:FixH family protein [Planctomycetota bacterium]
MTRRFIENRWAYVPVAMLSFTVTAAAVVVTLAFSDTNVTAAEPDYYRKAASWDDHKRQLAQNNALGWIVTPTIIPGTNDPTLARLELVVADKYGIGIEHASVQAEIIPILSANSRVTLNLPEGDGGHYGVDVPLRVNGQWEIRATVQSKGRLYTDDFRRHVSFGKPAAKNAPGATDAPERPGS